MKQLYQRSSAVTTADRLDTALRDAINTHAELNQLDNALAETTTACETRSVRLYKRTGCSPGSPARATQIASTGP